MKLGMTVDRCWIGFLGVEGGGGDKKWRGCQCVWMRICCKASLHPIGIGWIPVMVSRRGSKRGFDRNRTKKNHPSDPERVDVVVWIEIEDGMRSKVICLWWWFACLGSEKTSSVQSFLVTRTGCGWGWGEWGEVKRQEDEVKEIERYKNQKQGVESTLRVEDQLDWIEMGVKERELREAR